MEPTTIKESQADRNSTLCLTKETTLRPIVSLFLMKSFEKNNNNAVEFESDTRNRYRKPVRETQSYGRPSKSQGLVSI